MVSRFLATFLVAMFAFVQPLAAKPAHAGGPAYECWDGSVVKNPKHCPIFKLPVVCPDGKVVSDAKLCYTDPIICPDTGCTWPPPPVAE